MLDARIETRIIFGLGPFADHIGNAGPVDLEAGQINQDKAK